MDFAIDLSATAGVKSPFKRFALVPGGRVWSRVVACVRVCARDLSPQAREPTEGATSLWWPPSCPQLCFTTWQPHHKDEPIHLNEEPTTPTVCVNIL